MSESSDIIHFAIVGAGHIGSRHAHMIANNPRAVLVAITDVKIREELSIGDAIPLYDNLEEMLMHHANIDVVCIATPNGYHSQHAIQALSMGRHVVVEKPMALSVEECDAMMDEAMKRNKHIFCVMQNRFSPPSQWIKSLIDHNTLGELYQVQVVCYWNRDHRYYKTGHWHGTADLDGGVLFTQFSHFVDLMYWLLGPLQINHATSSNFNHTQLTEFDDSGQVLFSFGKRGQGSLSYSTSLYQQNFESSITIIGEKGTVKLGGQYMNSVDYCAIENYEMPILPDAEPPNDYGGYKGSAANHHFVIEDVISHLLEKTQTITTPLEGKAVVEIIEKIHRFQKNLSTSN
ncbi:MAG: Gfo/Idh/MocA family protein [Bacteroidota bacterium]|jgi:UDP-N-acetyl-2-amino-2-deoxyglucuronate dehydrogenase